MNREELLKIAKPILFSTPMVQAIIDNRKTVTRRVIKPRYKEDEYGFQVITNKATGERWIEKMDDDEGSFDNPRYVNPPYHIGDILYVRETWLIDDNLIWRYKANNENPNCLVFGKSPTWRPSIFMPKAATRILLKVTNVRVERLQDITIDECFQEGIREVHGMRSEARKWFWELWDSVIKKQDLDKYSWNANPWVWTIEFERVKEG